MSPQQASFLWHDYETWGTHPAFNGPAQFAAIRTDMELNEIGEPLMLYCKPPMDALPQPMACLITGITPQHAAKHGVPEAEFMRVVHNAMMQPKTCSVGYNNIRFDDEVTRFALYRNFQNPYAREWAKGNSRWDMLDVVRLCAALRPEGISWPKDENGLPSYKLEALTAANGIEHQGAHDALVDVRATIALARLIREKQPKLFDYALSMRSKDKVRDAIALGSGKPVFHVSGMFGNAHYCASMVLPLCQHPTNANAIICFDLRFNPAELLQLSVDDIRQRVFSKADALEGNERIALKSIHINKCPMVAPAAMVNDAVAARIGMDLALMRKHYDQLAQGISHNLIEKISAVFSAKEDAPQTLVDVDAALYSGGFFPREDEPIMLSIAKATPQALSHFEAPFLDARLPEMLFRYRARNWPEYLSEDELQRWREHCYQRITEPQHPALMDAENYQEQLEALFMQYQDDEQKSGLLSDLADWLDYLLSGE